MATRLADLAARVGGRVLGDENVEIDRICAIDDVDATALTFATNETYLRNALASRCAAVLTEPALAEKFPSAKKPLVLADSARKALALLLSDLEPPRPQGPYRHASAVVDPSAVIGPDVVIGPLVSIGPGAEVGAGSVLLAGVVIGAGARVGKRCLFHPRAMLLDRCVAGDDVILQASAVIGSDGFGYVFVDGRFVKIPQIGNVVLGDRVEIGACTCVDRAQTGTTSIGEGTKIDNLVQVGHNCRIGSNSAFAAFVGISGSTNIGDYTLVGGQAAFKGHQTIGSRVTIGGASHVWGDVPDGAFISGRPAQDHRGELRKQVRIRKLEKLFERVDALEKR
jgi:UDP-3-O-[3-hydroxymyristoyl] glucosamine N-acyltransferase